jgi:hypothetical protein
MNRVEQSIRSGRDSKQPAPPSEPKDFWFCQIERGGHIYQFTYTDATADKAKEIACNWFLDPRLNFTQADAEVVMDFVDGRHG